MSFNLHFEGNTLTALIKQSSWFPYKSGNLKFSATGGRLVDENTYLIHFSEVVAPYLTALEEGSGPHDIPGAFGRPLPFGIGGRFDGKFHPGSTKHKGFIKDKSIKAILDYFQKKYDAIIEVA